MNFYNILEVTPSASDDEIKHAFRRQAKRYHPDVNKEPDAEQWFILIYIAYEILSDKFKREIYDEYKMLQGRNDRLNRWEDRARKTGGMYADMPYEEFHETFLDKLQYHSSQVIGSIFALFILLLGVSAICGGVYFLAFERFNGSMVAGYLSLAFGGVILYTAITSFGAVIDTWRNKYL